MEKWNWSPDVDVLRAGPRRHMALTNLTWSFERLLTYVVLQHQGVSHVVFFEDSQPPFVFQNRTSHPLEFTRFVVATDHAYDGDDDDEGWKLVVVTMMRRSTI